jgi:hypothetical protein
MQVWTNTEFDGYYPVGVAAVVVANTPQQAAELLNAELVKRGLTANAVPEQFTKLPTNSPHAVVLNDGNY